MGFCGVLAIGYLRRKAYFADGIIETGQEHRRRSTKPPRALEETADCYSLVI
jgi:hypothetical protein